MMLNTTTEAPTTALEDARNKFLELKSNQDQKKNSWEAKIDENIETLAQKVSDSITTQILNEKIETLSNPSKQNNEEPTCLHFNFKAIEFSSEEECS
ncbi:MAG: hypothetical protein AAGG81_04615, partial [Chlamydiota bacterium]